MILSMHLATVAARNAANPAIHYLDKTTTYAQLRDDIGRLSYLFQKELGADPRIAVLASNAPAVIKTVFAVSNIRGVTIPVDPALSDEELGRWIRAAGATHLAITSDLVHRARDLILKERLGIPVIEIEKKRGGEYDTSFTPPPEQTPAETDVTVLFRTSGTTGEPRLVGLSHTQLHHAAVSLRRPYRCRPTDRYLTTANWADPFAFIHGMLLPLFTGGTAVCHYGAEGNDFLQFITEARVSRIVDSPRFFRKLLFTIKNAQQTIPTVRSVTVGHSLLAPELQRAFDMLKIRVSHCYGQTEAGWTISMSGTEPGEDRKEEADEPLKPGDGIPGEGLAGLKYKVLDEAGDAVETSERRTGRLAVSGPSVMTGYSGPDKDENKAATRDKLRGTWLYTGDIATLEGDGDELRITFLGREEDVIELKGRLVLPDSVDYALRGLKGIQDGAGFVTKTEMGKKVLAVAVVRVNGAKVSDHDVLAHIRQKMPHGTEPAAAFFTDEIPRSPNGTVERFRLARQFSGLIKA